MTNDAFYTPLSLGAKGSDELQLQGPELPFGLQETGLVHSYYQNLRLEWFYVPIFSGQPSLLMLSQHN